MMLATSERKEAGSRAKEILTERTKVKGSRFGKPNYKRCEADRKRVILLIGTGMTQERVAKVIGINVLTLMKHYEDEVRDAVDIFRAQLMEITEKAAAKGSGGAIKSLVALNMAAHADRELLAAPANAGAPGAPQIEGRVNKPLRIGKKEQQQQEANDVASGSDSEWGADLDVGRKP